MTNTRGTSLPDGVGFGLTAGNVRFFPCSSICPRPTVATQRLLEFGVPTGVSCGQRSAGRPSPGELTMQYATQNIRRMSRRAFSQADRDENRRSFIRACAAKVLTIRRKASPLAFAQTVWAEDEIAQTMLRAISSPTDRAAFPEIVARHRHLHHLDRAAGKSRSADSPARRYRLEQSDRNRAPPNKSSDSSRRRLRRIPWRSAPA
jgi:hypothetical protein